MTEELFDDEIYTLTDDDGNETQFELLGSHELDGVTYLALVPIDNNDEGEYVILKMEEDENGEESLVTIEDDDEFDRVADIFDDELFSDIDYDREGDDDDESADGFFGGDKDDE